MWYTKDTIITVQYLNNEVKLTTLQPRSDYKDGK